MNRDHRRSALPHLVWVFGASPRKLDAATWLETTRELRQLGWRVTLVAAGARGHQYIEGVDVLCLPMPHVFLLSQVVFHLELLRRLAHDWATIDVILFHQMSAPWILPLRLVRCIAGKKRPLLVMDTRTIFMMATNKQRWKDRLHRVFGDLMEQLANRWADGRLAITQRMAETVRIPQERLWGVWPSGVNLEKFASARSARRWPAPDEPIHLVYVGVLACERNLMTLCRAVEQANVEGMSFVLSLVGDGPERVALEKVAGQMGQRIRVVPPVLHDQVPEVLRQAHVGAVPFPDEEKFRVSSAIKLFEYMGAGLPVLATRIACNTDVIGAGNYAFWAEQADVPGLLAALGLAWQHRDSLSELGNQAAIAAQAWTWHESAKKLGRSLDYGLAHCG
jgi:glycosyltransferase involved in cell wall biosynthesis